MLLKQACVGRGYWGDDVVHNWSFSVNCLMFI